MTGLVGVAISTTSDRPGFSTSLAGWVDSEIEMVTVNRDSDRRGVAWNKNRGIAELMDAGCEHLLLADDDMYPLTKFAWTRYVDDPALHLSLSWGEHRLLGVDGEGHSLWKWPRGVLLYIHRSVIEQVGGFRTDYRVAHEHPDFSRRVFQAGLTPHMFMDLDQNPRDWFHAEDMPRVGERRHEFAARKRRNSTIRRTAADSKRIGELWEKYDGVTDYVEFR